MRIKSELTRNRTSWSWMICGVDVVIWFSTIWSGNLKERVVRSRVFHAWAAMVLIKFGDLS
jgi:hypothetical protein